MPRNYDRKIMFYLQLGEDLKTWVRAEAKRRGDISMSALIRILVIEEMKRNESKSK